MLKCLELTERGLQSYRLPFAPETPRRLHGDRAHVSKIVGYETSRVHFPEQQAAFSIKCSLGGPVAYILDGRRIVVEEDRYLLVNHEHAYASYVESDTPVEALSIFFASPMVEDVLRSLIEPASTLLSASEPRSQRFFEHLHEHDDAVLPILKSLHLVQGRSDVEAGWVEERLHLLLEAIARTDQGVRRKIAELPSVRASTRSEVYRRVSVARDFLTSNSHQPLRLEAIAAEACMAPHHFLRSFKQVVGRTPHQYLIEVRLQRARRLLQSGRHTVADASSRAGFESWEHFSRQYRRRFGSTPGRARTA